jgi:hypothetical protein
MRIANGGSSASNGKSANTKRDLWSKRPTRDRPIGARSPDDLVATTKCAVGPVLLSGFLPAWSVTRFLAGLMKDRNWRGSALTGGSGQGRGCGPRGNSTEAARHLVRIRCRQLCLRRISRRRRGDDHAHRSRRIGRVRVGVYHQTAHHGGDARPLHGAGGVACRLLGAASQRQSRAVLPGSEAELAHSGVSTRLAFVYATSVPKLRPAELGNMCPPSCRHLSAQRCARFGRESGVVLPGPASPILTEQGRRVGSLGPGLACESADARPGCPANRSAGRGPGFFWHPPAVPA